MTISAIPPPSQSPQPTSLSPPPSLPSSPRDEPSTLTSHFVQALHDYLPTNAPADAAVSCLFFRKGAIIEVFTRDDSGWWDGQCGGVRGWFPSNYVGRIGEAVRHSSDFEDEHSQREWEDWRNRVSSTHVQDHEASPEVTPLATSTVAQDNSKPLLNRVEQARALLNEDSRRRSDDGLSNAGAGRVAGGGGEQHQQQQQQMLVTQVDDKVAELLEACEHPESANIQLAIFHVVSSIRAVLTAANTVSNDSPLLKCYPELARQRKKVLSALSKLVLKGKELQAAQDGNMEAVLQQIPVLTNALAVEFNTFINLLHAIPPAGDEHDQHQQVSPRSSLLSVDSVATNSTQSLKQQLVEARLSSASLIAKAVPLSDAQHILQNLLEHQAAIDDLMHKLQSTIEKFLSHRQRATEMLEMTRRSVEAVRTFLAVVEHVCSNVGELDYKHCSIIPEDPHLVALVLAKESVYSAITNLVTSVRALAGSRGRREEHDMTQIQENCEKVVRTINDSAARVRICLQVDERDIIDKEHVYAMRKELESTVEARRNQTLSILGRKATSLNVLQHQYDEPELKRSVSRESHLENIAENDHDDSRAVDEQQVQELDVAKNTLTTTIRVDIKQQQQQQQNDKAAAAATAAEVPAAPPSTSTSITRRPRALSKPGRRPNVVGPATTRVTSGASMNSARTSQGSSQLRQSVRSSVESSNMTPLTTPEIMSPVTEVTTDQQQHRPGSVVAHPSPSVSSLSKHLAQPELRLSSSKSTPITENSSNNNQRIRRPRESSMSAMRMSVKPRADDLRLSTTSESLTDPQQIRRVSSWLSMAGNDRRESLASTERHSKMEPEPWFLKQRQFSEDELMVNADGQVTGATIEALVEKLTLHEKSPDLIFTRAFFYNFRLFTTPAEFLDLLIQRFALKPPTEAPLSPQEMALWTNRVLLPVRLRVYNVIKSWLETYFSFEHDACIEKSLIDFTAGPLSEAMPGPAKRMMELIRKRFASKSLAATGRKMSYTKDSKSLYQQKPASSGSHLSLSSGSSLFSTLTLFEDHHHSSVDQSTSPPPPTPNVARSLRSTLRKASSQGNLTLVHISEFDPVELARQLTLMESCLFCQIKPSEMIGQEFKKKVGQSSAVHVKAMIQRSTQITSWVSDTILRETDAKKRAQMIKFWIKVGDSCLQLSNYNTLMAIRSALDSTSIARLKKTWDLVSAKNKALYDPIHKATDSRRNFAEYRNRLKNAVAPCLPFLGVYLTDMTFIDDGNANYRTSPNGHQLINFDKYIKITRILNEIDQFQIPYRLTEVEEIQRYLLQCLETVETDNGVFYAKSLQLEPREEEFDIKSFISNLS